MREEEGDDGSVQDAAGGVASAEELLVRLRWLNEAASLPSVSWIAAFPLEELAEGAV